MAEQPPAESIRTSPSPLEASLLPPESENVLLPTEATVTGIWNAAQQRINQIQKSFLLPNGRERFFPTLYVAPDSLIGHQIEGIDDITGTFNRRLFVNHRAESNGQSVDFFLNGVLGHDKNTEPPTMSLEVRSTKELLYHISFSEDMNYILVGNRTLVFTVSDDKSRIIVTEQGGGEEISEELSLQCKRRIQEALIITDFDNPVPGVEILSPLPWDHRGLTRLIQDHWAGNCDLIQMQRQINRLVESGIIEQRSFDSALQEFVEKMSPSMEKDVANETAIIEEIRARDRLIAIYQAEKTKLENRLSQVERFRALVAMGL